jgi:hypothetical protein
MPAANGCAYSTPGVDPERHDGYNSPAFGASLQNIGPNCKTD